MVLIKRFLLLLAAGGLGYGAVGWNGAGVGLAAGLLVVFLERELERSGSRTIVWRGVGVAGGLAIAFLISPVVHTVLAEQTYAPYVTVFLYLGLGYLGASLPALWRRQAAASASGSKGSLSIAAVRANGCVPKILDTSVIIDGRIVDILNTNFLEGPLIVPRFVLRELQLIADSSDSLRRARGRRGLDLLKEMQEKDDGRIQIEDVEVSGARDVDGMLVRLARSRSARIITNDLNLNKVAQVEGVTVLNVNDLANALKPVVLPGEEMNVRLLRRGKEMDQGVGYLEDGTMVVVENASDLIGQTVRTEVTSVLQTAAGRMIFCKMRD